MLELIIIIVCLLINAILAGSETAFIAVRRPQVNELAKQGNKKAKILLDLRANPERTLSIVQVGITFVGALAAAVGGAGAEEVIAPWLKETFGFREVLAEFISLIIVVVPFTFISVVLGELVPKTFALRRTLFLATESAPWLHLMSRLLNPLVSIFEWSTKTFMKIFPKHQVTDETTSDEQSIELGILPIPNRQYVLNIVKIEKTTVKEILVNWKDVVRLSEDFSLEQVEDIIISSAHTRLPVVKNQEVIGMINAKEFLAIQKNGMKEWKQLIRSAIKIQAHMPILTALQIMQENRTQMAIVYLAQDIIGMITMEMIFEEIIGDIYDEDDESIIHKKTIKQYF